jgi:hypothetical protein
VPPLTAFRASGGWLLTVESPWATGRALIKAAAAVLVSEDNRSLLGLQHGQRIFREAGFLLVLGSRHAIRASLIKRLLDAPE